MKTSTAIIALSLCALVAATGCRKGQKKAAANDFDGDTMLTDLSTDGIPLNLDTPCDEQGRERAYDANVETLYFGYDSYTLPSSELYKVEAVADYMNRNANSVLIVEGHCDERGSNEYNLSLGEQRALAIRAYLCDLGIDSSRIQTRSLGEERPAAIGSGEAIWRQNRRGEFLVFK